jgi:hypothetical protein
MAAVSEDDSPWPLPFRSVLITTPHACGGSRGSPAMEFRVSISKQTMSRELRALGLRKLSARPRHHAKSEAAAELFKKSSRPAWRRSPPRQAAGQ